MTQSPVPLRGRRDKPSEFRKGDAKTMPKLARVVLAATFLIMLSARR
jgi:hypothetical protein